MVVVVVLLVIVLAAVRVFEAHARRALAGPVRVPLHATAELHAKAAEAQLLVGEGGE